MFVNQYGIAIPDEELLHKFCSTAINMHQLVINGTSQLAELIRYNNDLLRKDSTKSHLTVLYTALRHCNYWTRVYVEKGMLFIMLDESHLKNVSIRQVVKMMNNPSEITVAAYGNEVINPVEINDFLATVFYTCVSLLYIAGFNPAAVRYEYLAKSEYMDTLTNVLLQYSNISHRVGSLAIWGDINLL